MHWERGWPKQLYVLFIEKPEILRKGTSAKILLTLQRSSIFKNRSIYYDKDFETTSLSQYWWLYCQIWKCFCLLRLILETTTQNNFSKFRKFSRKYLHCSFIIVKSLPLLFTEILLMFLETYDFIELYHDLWRFIPDLADSGSSLIYNTSARHERHECDTSDTNVN